MTERLTANLGIAVQAVAFFFVWSGRVMAGRFAGRLPPLTVPRAVSAALLLSGAVALFVSARRALGPQWSIQARTIATHQLITLGPYRVVRHPIYIALGLFLVAVGIVNATWWVLAAALALYAIGAGMRMRAEDRLLARQFGPVFEAYRQHVPAVLPRRGSS